MNRSYHIEIPMVKHGTVDLRLRLERFAAKFEQVIAVGQCPCLTDNAMGKLAFQGHELIRELRLRVPTEKVMIHLNTFHSRSDLDEILESCLKLNIRQILVVSGDGSIRLPKLQPRDIGCGGEAVTSVELLHYIKQRHPDCFRLGVAFNQYEPAAPERDKLRRKLDAGADFVITQPVIAPDPVIDRLLRELPVPVYLEAWLSPKIELLNECIGGEIDSPDGFEPIGVLRALETHYPNQGFYLAVLNFAKQFDQVIHPEVTA